MSKRGDHLTDLVCRPRDAWEAYLRRHSNLPGPRGNLELLDALGDAVAPDDEELLRAWAAIAPDAAPTNDPGEFVVCAGVVGLGALLAALVAARGGPADADAAGAGLVTVLRAAAADPRWRVREAVAIALQRLGAADVAVLLDLAESFAADPDPLVERAAVAALCEPALLRTGPATRATIAVLDRVTANLAATDAAARRGAGVVALGKALGYGWSVAIVADPLAGWPAFERWLEADDRDVRRVVRENLAKARLLRVDAARVAALQARLGG